MNKTTDNDDEVRQKMSDEKEKLIPLIQGEAGVDAMLDLIGSTASQLETLQRLMGISTLFTVMARISKSEGDSDFSVGVEQAAFKIMDCIVLIRLYKDKFHPIADQVKKAYESKN